MHTFRGKAAVYVHAHGISYTLEEIEAWALKYQSFKKIAMKGMGVLNRLLILDPVTGKTMPKPPGAAMHPLHHADHTNHQTCFTKLERWSSSWGGAL